MIAMSKGGNWYRALELFNEMKVGGMEITEGIYTAALTACAKGGQWTMALELIREMHVQGEKPSVFAYNAAILACRRDSQWVQVSPASFPSA